VLLLVLISVDRNLIVMLKIVSLRVLIVLLCLFGMLGIVCSWCSFSGVGGSVLSSGVLWW